MRTLLLCACLLALLLAGCSESATVRAKGQWEGSVSTVSYTHLTLPTN